MVCSLVVGIVLDTDFVLVNRADRNDKLESYPMAKLIIDTALNQATKKNRHLKHPIYCLEAIEYGVENGG